MFVSKPRSRLGGRDDKCGGYIALIGVLIAGALMLLIGVGSSLRGIDTLNAVSGEESSFRAVLLGDACAEEALLRLKGDLAYSGNETIIVGGGETCRILPLSGTGNIDRVITTQGIDNNYVRNVRVDIAQVNPSLQIRTWVNIP
jgi:hypothetical protein